MTAPITKATYLGARRELLITGSRFRAYANREPSRREHFAAKAKDAQRHLAQLRRLRALGLRPVRYA